MRGDAAEAARLLRCIPAGATTPSSLLTELAAQWPDTWSPQAVTMNRSDLTARALVLAFLETQRHGNAISYRLTGSGYSWLERHEEAPYEH